MSKLDKEKVLAEYEQAYQKAHGKKPTIEASNGWYSVDGGKNVRLAQLAEEAKALGSAAAGSSKPKAEKKPAAKTSAAKKPAAKKSTTKKTSSASAGGLTAKELWRKKLEQDATQCRLPRGSF